MSQGDHRRRHIGGTDVVGNVANEAMVEGVETPQRLAFLKSAGCAQCQGNLFSYPLDEDALIGFLIRQYEKPLIS